MDAEKGRIRQLMPMIDWIRNEKLRNEVAEVWVEAWKQSEWEDIADCPYRTEVKAVNVIQHTNFVVTTAMAMASFISDTWEIQVDTDLLLACAILHDVSKLIEYSPHQIGRSEIGENLAHGEYGVHLALNVGLPIKVINVITAHSPKSPIVPEFAEGIIVCYADYAMADLFSLASGLPLLLSTIKGVRGRA